MSKADEKKLDKMVADFEKAHPDAGKNLRTLLSETPAFKANLIDAIKKGNLDKIDVLPSSAPAGALGAYDAAGKAMLLPDTLLAKVDKDKTLANTMRMVLTHESEHAINKQAIEKAEADFAKGLEKIAKGPSPHDYTDILKKKGDSDRLREATDQIGGFNAVAAHVRKDNPKATKEQLYEKLYNASPEMEAYFDRKGTAPSYTYEPKAGLTLDKDGKLAKTPANIEAMAKHFYDARPYRQIYGVDALKQAIGVEAAQQTKDAAADPKYKAPEVRVNLKALGLDGVVTIPPGAGITDTSPKPPPPKAPVTGSPTSPATSGAEPAPALYLQSVSALEKLGSGANLGTRDELNAVAAAMASKAQKDGLSQIDAVVASRDGKGLIAVQGDPTTAHARTSYIDRADAAQQPLERNLGQLQNEPLQIAIPQPAQSQQQAGPAR
ncbi:MAG: XVIPCD domain-containing protein [Pseudomonadota bacterium]